MDMTSRLAMPLLAAGQLLKEQSHNEALLTLDLLVGGTIAPGSWTAPPGRRPVANGTGSAPARLANGPEMTDRSRR